MIVHVELSTMYSVLDTMVISGADVCCSVVFRTLVGVFSVMWSELLMTSAICCLVVISVQVPESGVCIVVCDCAVSRRYINVCNCDMFSVVNVYLDHLKFCVVCIDGRRYVCCSECNVVSNECNEPTSCLVQPIDMHGSEVMYIVRVCFRGELGFLNCDDICICVVNKQFELLDFFFHLCCSAV